MWMSVLQLVQCDGDAARRITRRCVKLRLRKLYNALWDSVITVTAENGPMGWSNLEYYGTHVNSTCASGHSQLGLVVLGTYVGINITVTYTLHGGSCALGPDTPATTLDLSEE